MSEPVKAETEEKAGAKLVTVLYSIGRDLYRVIKPAPERDIWLSTAKQDTPPPELQARGPFIGIVKSGDGWRKAYSVDWSVVRPGGQNTLPEDDALVADYMAAMPKAAGKKS
jgi:hypothetical protein